ncbi:MAG: antibiotic biosynthesis monooxygenase [Planktothrix sp. GU0601_MAG3]|nr:MAG: antibiotic biosynthesis monooxygenase [Planktothrix sp. GU0601_MAG3]
MNNYETSTEVQTGNLYTEFYQDPNNPQNYLLIEKWKDYSNLDQHQSSTFYQEFITQLNTLVETPVGQSIETIDTDSYGKNQKVLVGKFQAKEGTREQIKDLASQLI